MSKWRHEFQDSLKLEFKTIRNSNEVTKTNTEISAIKDRLGNLKAWEDPERARQGTLEQRKITRMPLKGVKTATEGGD